MIVIENVDVYGFEAAIRGMRNAMNSWANSDSGWELKDIGGKDHPPVFNYILGPNDIKLAKTLAAAGNDHGKFLRFINVYCDIVAPLYWHKEMDTYRYGVEKNSCSTMHKIQAKEFELDDFSHEHLNYVSLDELERTIYILNKYRWLYNDWEKLDENTKNAWRVYDQKDAWWQMIQLLPSSYNQRRTYQIDYQTLRNIYFAREGHKLDEWLVFRRWELTLPYFKDICMQGD